MPKVADAEGQAGGCHGSVTAGVTAWASQVRIWRASIAFTPLHEIPLYSFVAIPAYHKTPPPRLRITFSSPRRHLRLPPHSRPHRSVLAPPAMYEEVCLLCSRPITVDGCVSALLMSVSHQTLTCFHHVTSSVGHTAATSARALTLPRRPSRLPPVRTPRRTSAQTMAQAALRMSRPWCPLPSVGHSTQPPCPSTRTAIPSRRLPPLLPSGRSPRTRTRSLRAPDPTRTSCLSTAPKAQSPRIPLCIRSSHEAQGYPTLDAPLVPTSAPLSRH